MGTARLPQRKPEGTGLPRVYLNRSDFNVIVSDQLFRRIVPFSARNPRLTAPRASHRRSAAAAPPDPAFFMALLDVRVIFEPAAARMAAARASPEQILQIERAFEAMAAALPDDVESCCAHDLAFHELITSATGN